MEQMQIFIAVILIILLLEVSYLVFRASSRGFSARRGGRLVLLDTSALIDGRISIVAKTGFIGGTLVIPRSVIGELQLLADTADHDKRARARHGLDVVVELQAMPNVNVEILQDGSKAREGVDERLLTLAKKHGAAICTLDYNLNKVAAVEDIEILNVNELSQSIRMAHLPGEKLRIELVQKGQDSHQGVGYLADGTMVVVENASSLIGQNVEVEVTRSLQTAAGRMMFARQVGAKSNGENVTRQKARAAQPAKPAQQTKGSRPQQPQKKSAKQSTSKAKSVVKPKQARHRKPQDAESKLIDLVRDSEN